MHAARSQDSLHTRPEASQALGLKNDSDDDSDDYDDSDDDDDDDDSPHTRPEARQALGLKNALEWMRIEEWTREEYFGDILNGLADTRC